MILPAFGIVIIIIGGLGLIFWNGDQNKVTKINSFEECQQAGYSITKGIPSHCSTPDGRDFVAKSTLRGELVCLPRKDSLSGTTLECLYGLKDNAGIYYALHNKKSLKTEELTTLMGKKVEITGILMRTVENYTSKYQDKWTIEIESIRGL